MVNRTEEVSVLARDLRRFVRERDWEKYHSAKNLAVGVAIEAAELVEHFHWLTDDESIDLDDNTRRGVEEEIGDVLIYVLLLCDTLGIDAVHAARQKLEKNRKKYPVEKARGRREKYDQL